jgi:hypothetical protein
VASESLAPDAVTAIAPADTQRWIAKAQQRVAPLREAIAAVGGSSRRVRARCVPDLGEAAFGNFMLSWPEQDGDDMILNHLPDGAFFLQLLRLAYRPVMERRPHLRACLLDGSRLELAFTNDVLQVQAAGPPGPYSMVRHHALVLHAATHWLDEPARSRWLELYEALAATMMARRSAPPSAGELRDIEGSAFADMRAYAGQTLEHTEAAALLADPVMLGGIADYQVMAATAIAVLERDRLSRRRDAAADWVANQLAAATRDDYLLEAWGRLL